MDYLEVNEEALISLEGPVPTGISNSSFEGVFTFFNYIKCLLGLGELKFITQSAAFILKSQILPSPPLQSAIAVTIAEDS